MEKINKLIRLFNREKIDGYIIPKNDEFFGEYIPDYKDRLKFISNFNGSFGFAIILKKENFLFVDGRYTLQAKKESVKNFKIITFPNQLPKDIFKNKKITLGFDPKITTKKFIINFFKDTSIKFLPLKFNLIDYIWKRGQKTRIKKFYVLPKNSVGENYNAKINRVINNLKKKKVDYQFISASENNAWLLNIRGSDSSYAPLTNCYILVSKNKNITLICNLKKISENLKKRIKRVKFLDIKFTEEILSKIKGKKFIIDRETCSIFFENTISLNNTILNFNDPIYYFKAIKSKKEIANIKKAHINDGVALSKYLFWLKKNYLKKKITEISASKKLLNFRRKNKDFLFSSFPTISGTGPNGAIIHYKASKETNRQLKKGDIYLVDSGGQYKYGTTDVTRTISLNNSEKRIKNIFTRVLKGHIAVTNFILNKKTSGCEIDIEARKYLKQINLDYSHGTGHGVGYFLNVHEGPQSISKKSKVPFIEGMIVSNEPGYYEKNKFGIRIENLIYVKKMKKNKIFENLTMVPIDKNLINSGLLTRNEKKWLNTYHRKVFNNLKSKMNKLELEDLKKACSAI